MVMSIYVQRGESKEMKKLKLNVGVRFVESGEAHDNWNDCVY